MADDRPLWRRAAVELVRGINAGRFAVDSVVEAHLARISDREATVRAWAFHDPAGIREHERRMARPASGSLAGLPVGVKDNIDTCDMPTSYGSPIYRDHRPRIDADAVARLKAAGAVIIGKTVTAELAFVTPGATVNPHRADRTPGGSSSGSAAAVADFMVPLALGSQTGGSTIRPAAFCGIVGFKPTHGVISTAGMKPLAPSLDTIGLLARSVDDVALLFSALRKTQSEAAEARVDRGLRIAWYAGPDAHRASADAQSALRDARDVLVRSGAAVLPMALPAALFASLGEAQRTIMAFEAAEALAFEYASKRSLLSAAVVDLLERGRGLSDTAYRSALALVSEGRAALVAGLAGCDALMTFSAPGEAPPGPHTGDSVFNRIWTALGSPCVTLPFGKGGDARLPLGVQLVGVSGDDSSLLAVAREVEMLFESSNREAMQ